MKTQQFGWCWTEELQKARNEVLRTFASVEIPDQRDEYVTPGELLKSIQELLDRCYDFSLNPLPHLRKYFHLFDWEFHDLGEDVGVFGSKVRERAEEKVRRIINRSDYLWPVYCNHGQIVSAVPKTPLDRGARGVCWEPSWDPEFKHEGPRYDLFHHAGGNTYGFDQSADDDLVKF